MDFETDRAKLLDGADQRAVAPVIGIVLMIAITVILAAVIAGFVLDMGTTLPDNAQAGTNVEFDSSEGLVSVTYTSGQSADYIVATLTDSNGDVASYKLTEPGSVVTLSVSTNGSGDGESWETAASSTGGAVTAKTPATDTYNDNGADDGFGLRASSDDHVRAVVTVVNGDTEARIATESGTI